MSGYNLRSKRVNGLEYEPTELQLRFRELLRPKVPTQFVSMYFEHFECEASRNFTIGVFDSEITACHATIKWLIDNGKGIDYRLEVWKKYCYEHNKIIRFLCKQVSNYDDLKRILFEYGCVWTYKTCWHIDLF